MIDQAAFTVRATLIALITSASLNAPSDGREALYKKENGLTLVAVDAKRVADSLRVIGMLTGNVVIAGTGSYILYTQAGLAFSAPLGVALINIALSTWLSRASADSQRRFLEATERRIQHVSDGLTELRSIRQTALEPVFMSETAALRTTEIARASKYRRAEVLFVMLCEAQYHTWLFRLLTHGS
jgi:hypothetical protein